MIKIVFALAILAASSFAASGVCLIGLLIGPWTRILGKLTDIFLVGGFTALAIAGTLIFIFFPQKIRR